MEYENYLWLRTKLKNLPVLTGVHFTQEEMDDLQEIIKTYSALLEPCREVGHHERFEEIKLDGE